MPAGTLDGGVITSYSIHYTKLYEALTLAIVDEVDSILIDEARTPLIISGPAEESTDLYRKINAIIPKLQKSYNFV